MPYMFCRASEWASMDGAILTWHFRSSGTLCYCMYYIQTFSAPGRAIIVIYCAESVLRNSDVKTINGGVKYTEYEKNCV